MTKVELECLDPASSRKRRRLRSRCLAQPLPFGVVERRTYCKGRRTCCSDAWRNALYNVSEALLEFLASRFEPTPYSFMIAWEVQSSALCSLDRFKRRMSRQRIRHLTRCQAVHVPIGGMRDRRRKMFEWALVPISTNLARDRIVRIGSEKETDRVPFHAPMARKRSFIARIPKVTLPVRRKVFDLIPMRRIVKE